MRTRRSPRNQDRLFKELFKPERKPFAPIVSPVCFNCVSYPSKRMYAVCRGSRKGQRVSGLAQHPCFGAKGAK